MLCSPINLLKEQGTKIRQRQKKQFNNMESIAPVVPRPTGCSFGYRPTTQIKLIPTEEAKSGLDRHVAHFMLGVHISMLINTSVRYHNKKHQKTQSREVRSRFQ